MTKRAEAKYKIDRRMGENIWGGPEPVQQARIWARPARPAPQGQGDRLRHPAQGQAEGQGLLRQHFRAPVPQILCRGAPPEGRLERQSHRLAGAPARRARLPRQIRADGVRGPPVRQPRPHQRQRQAGQYRFLSGQGWGRDRDQGILATVAAGARSGGARRAGRARLCRGRPRQGDGETHRVPGLSKCPIRRTWSRTWSSNSTRADCRSAAKAGPLGF